MTPTFAKQEYFLACCWAWAWNIQQVAAATTTSVVWLDACIFLDTAKEDLQYTPTCWRRLLFCQQTHHTEHKAWRRSSNHVASQLLFNFVKPRSKYIIEYYSNGKVNASCMRDRKFRSSMSPRFSVLTPPKESSVNSFAVTFESLFWCLWRMPNQFRLWMYAG